MESSESGFNEKNAARALLWIIDLLREQSVAFQVTGGLATWFYGSKRPLVDLDIDVRDEDLPLLARRLAPYIVFGPARFFDEQWDVELLTVTNAGFSIDISGAGTTRIFSRSDRQWIPAHANLATAVTFEVLGVDVPVVNKEDLLTYKRCLDRDVDRQDIAAIDS